MVLAVTSHEELPLQEHSERKSHRLFIQRDAPLSPIGQNGAQRVLWVSTRSSGQNTACATESSVRIAGEVARPAQHDCISVLSSALSSPKLVASQRDVGQRQFPPSLGPSRLSLLISTCISLPLPPSKPPSCFVFNSPWQQLGCGSLQLPIQFIVEQ